MSDRTGWPAVRPWVADLAGAGLCFAVSSPVVVIIAYYHRAPAAGYFAGLALACLPLLVRSRWPFQVVAATLAANAAQLALLSFPGPSPAATGVALYTVAVRTERRTAWRIGAASAALLFAVSVIRRPGPDSLWQYLAVLAGMGLAVASGDAVRSSRRLLAAAVERADRAEHTREAEARRRVTEERLRIARELHDVVAHHITLVNAQAGVAHHLMRSDPDHAYQALERIRDTSRAALDELRTTVGLLRHGESPDAPREPAPGLAGLDALLASFRHSGLDITLERTGHPTEPASITDLAAYRIIQEALTNTRKHAGPVPARVHLDYRPDVLRLTVEDDGRAGTGTQGGPGSGTGHGMIGMYERAKAARGTLTAGPHPAGGFRIHAELPLHTGRKG
ncbi:two-component sensor histidine kinase [Streptomyces albospinus]|uniref:histidine kinase n=1 Tax=Streptomyces albospinus TaxID=285515 RepID=A0ABQ2UZE0_9ACTN|nr:histidine kinase [Streptomyces albospinus]GGU59659.1 two-component sensor histidine kinase [Streptomyces albospinus]